MDVRTQMRGGVTCNAHREAITDFLHWASGAPTSDETASDFVNAIHQCYGETEVLPIAMMSPAGVVRLARHAAALRCAADLG